MDKKLIGVALVVLAGCATQPDKIQTAYVSPVQYQDFDCNQIAAESARVNRRAAELQARLKTAADNDGAQMAIGMILFWPALFLLEGGDGPEAAEYARLKGERDALEEAAVQKKCLIPTEAGIQVQGVSIESAPASIEGANPEIAEPARSAPKGHEGDEPAATPGG